VKPTLTIWDAALENISPKEVLPVELSPLVLVSTTASENSSILNLSSISAEINLLELKVKLFRSKDSEMSDIGLLSSSNKTVVKSLPSLREMPPSTTQMVLILIIAKNI